MYHILSLQECSKWPIEKCDVSKKAVTKYTPKTACNKVPVEICGPSSCPLVAGPEECYERTKTITSEKPDEECSLEPRVECKHVTKLVPQLKPTESCVDVPKEVCVRSRTNPRKVKKPVIKKWCYTPSPESGLDPGPNYNGADTNREPTVAETCPRHCEEAKQQGRCDPRCNEYADLCGVPDCSPPPPPPPPACPQICLDAIRRGTCETSCERYASICNYKCPAPTPPPPVICPSKCRNAFTRNNDRSCDIPECPPISSPPVTTPAPPPSCPPKCRDPLTRASDYDCQIPECPPAPPPPPPPTDTYLPPAEQPLPTYGNNRGGRRRSGANTRPRVNTGFALPNRGSRQFVANFDAIEATGTQFLTQ